MNYLWYFLMRERVFFHIFMPPFEKGGAYCFAPVCRYVGRYVGRSVGRYVGSP